jgi:hypothetical protein
LYVATTLPDMIYVWRGDVSLIDALSRGRLEMLGEAWAMRAFPRWLARSKYASVKPVRRTGGQARSITRRASA